MNTQKTSILYSHSGKFPLASKISFLMRRKMFVLFMEIMSPTEDMLILDLGVTCDETYQESNYFEQLYPYKHKIVCAGTEDGSYLEEKYPGITFMPVEANRHLPFSDQQFDVVFSNAVIEHVGAPEDQEFFIREILRVGKRFYMTTPNRWFPVEMHTGLPLLHYLPMSLYRAILRKIGFRYWASEKNLNLLEAKQFVRLFPKNSVVQVMSVKLLGISSNLIAYGRK